MDQLRVTLEDGQSLRCPAGTPVCSILKSHAEKNLPTAIGALVNNQVVSLSYTLKTNCEVRFLIASHPLGMRIYRDSLSFLLAMAASRMSPEARICVEHSLSTGYFYTVEPGMKKGGSASWVRRLEEAMRRLVAADLPIERRKLSFADAIALFEKQRLRENSDLLRFRNPPSVTIHWCDGFCDLTHGPLAPSTGHLDCFRLIDYPPGLVLQFPDRVNPQRVTKFRDQPHLFQIFHEHKEWGRILGVASVGRLNELIAGGRAGDFIKVAEAFHEKKIARIADAIHARRKHVRVIFISGPSSAGKTTLAKRLGVQLYVNGIRPVTLSLDNYYVDDPRTPRDSDGKPDYEHIRAVDIGLFNRQVKALIEGREVELPRFDFNLKRRVRSGLKLKIGPDQVIIVEGIHGLNPMFTPMLDRRSIFKIYISALTQLNIDRHNRISTTDNRLMRRIVRDHAFRGNSPLTTIRMWPSVRRGEKKWIFPFQEQADVFFNSALDYELAVLKPLVEPLLMQVKPNDAEYAEAARLQEFLANFLPIPKNLVPNTSILREFIGSSAFRY